MGGHKLNGGQAAKLAHQLQELVGQWEKYDAEQRSVVRAAAAYFLKADDAIPDYEVGGLVDDEAVVDAAFAAVGRKPDSGNSDGSKCERCRYTRSRCRCRNKAVLHNDITFDIYSGGDKLGSVRISKGSIDWAPARRRSFKRISWERFATTMNELYDARR